MESSQDNLSQGRDLNPIPKVECQSLDRDVRQTHCLDVSSVSCAV
jgi:hypothetical protein